MADVPLPRYAQARNVDVVDHDLDDTKPLPTAGQNAPIFNTGSATVDGTDAPTALHEDLEVERGHQVRVKAMDGNAGTVFVGWNGADEAEDFPLAAGKAVKIATGDVGDISVVGTDADDEVRWIVEGYSV